jgi:hypothetical protein
MPGGVAGVQPQGCPLCRSRPMGRAFSFLELKMEAMVQTTDLPEGVSADGTASANLMAPLDLKAKTVEQVCAALSSFLRKTELEPEWICPANYMDDPNEARFGARHERLWPDDTVSNRIAVSVFTGASEGWLIYVNLISRGTQAAGWGYSVMPMLRAKVFSRDQAWHFARVLARKLDVA